MHKIKLCFLLTLSLATSFVHAQDSLCPPTRPKVGVVLAGGGARGASFIGVLKYLEELDIPIDYVIGTSMGSVVGGVYALGYSPDEMSQIITSIDWSKIIGNNIDRSMLSKSLRDRNSTQIINVPINIKGIMREGLVQSFLSELPSAYVNNHEVDNLFNDLCYGYQDNINFDDLPIPFVCVATDIVSGEEVVIREGNLPKAIRASMAFPALFSPVVIDGRLLYDGGLTNIFPSDVLHDMGIDIIIGIEFSSEKYFKGETIPSVTKLFDYIYNFAIHIKREDNLKLCDILIKPNAAEYSALSFTPEAIDTLIHRGYIEATKNHDALIKLKHEIDSLAGRPVTNEFCQNRIPKLRDQQFLVNDIEMIGPTQTQAKWLERKGKLHEGSIISLEDIRRSIKLFQGTGAFDRISYSLKETDTTTEAYKLTMKLHQPSPDILGFGIHYDTEESAALLFTLGLNEKRLSGPKLNLRGRLSFNPQFTPTITFPVSNIVCIKLQYDLRWQFARMALQDYQIYDFRNLRNEVKAYLSTYQTRDIQADAGFFYTSNTYNHISNNNSEQNVLPPNDYFADNQLIGAYFNFSYDNLDHYYFAKRGVSLTLQGHVYSELKASPPSYQDISVSFLGFLTPGGSKITLIPQFYGRMVFGETTYTNLCNVIGGEVAGRYFPSQMPFIGANGLTVMNSNAAILRCDLRYNFYGNHYLSCMGNMAVGTGDPMRHESIDCFTGVGIKYSYKSPLGPISLTGQWSDLNHSVTAYFSFGHYF